ncbi:hypothetical protein ARMSODRAFT_978887 [Armillaria solidipes]|uniref:Uncharacterized protein n=1 Tax=Armillaria solidipes TaxID=1076256 RepID=A0A2H3B6Z6_9AGAR|nr:hypothetical protein ARMSODRAFT_978887 [Armillaria solidipes]
MTRAMAGGKHHFWGQVLAPRVASQPGWQLVESFRIGAESLWRTEVRWFLVFATLVEGCNSARELRTVDGGDHSMQYGEVSRSDFFHAFRSRFSGLSQTRCLEYASEDEVEVSGCCASRGTKLRFISGDKYRPPDERNLHIATSSSSSPTISFRMRYSESIALDDLPVFCLPILVDREAQKDYPHGTITTLEQNKEVWDRMAPPPFVAEQGRPRRV